MSSEEVFYGDVIFFDGKKGYGFIKWEKDGVAEKDLFVHFSDVNSQGFKILYKDQKVSFKLGFNKNNVIKAVEVTVLRN